MQTIANFKLPAGKGTVLRDTHVKFKGASGITGSMKAGYVDDFLLENCIISGDPDQPGVQPTHPNWAMRAYNLRRAILRKTIFRNIEKEHGPYFSNAGDVLIDGCTFTDLGSQAIQNAQREMDLIGGRADNVKCLLKIVKCSFERCATPFGRRPSWNVSIFAFDENLRVSYPNGAVIQPPHKGHLVRSLTDVEIVDCDFEGYGYPHTASGNRDCDSTGAILVQDRMNLLIGRCRIEFNKPDRELIQIRNVANAVVKPIYLNGGDLVLHDMDRCTVKISPGSGDGEIRRRVLNSHTTTPLSTIKKGYSH